MCVVVLIVQIHCLCSPRFSNCAHELSARDWMNEQQGTLSHRSATSWKHAAELHQPASFLFMRKRSDPSATANSTSRSTHMACMTCFLEPKPVIPRGVEHQPRILHKDTKRCLQFYAQLKCVSSSAYPLFCVMPIQDEENISHPSQFSVCLYNSYTSV